METQLYDDEIKGKIYDRELLKRLLSYTRPYKLWIIASVFLIMLASGLELLWPQFIRLAIDNYVDNSQLSAAAKYEGVLLLAGLYFLTLLFSVVLEYSRIMIMSYTGQHVMHDIRMALFAHVQTLSVHFFTKNPVGRLVTRLTNDVAQLNELFTTGIVGIFGDVIMLAGIVILMIWMHLKLALISFTVLPLIFAAVILFRRFIRPAYLEIRKNLARVNAFIQEHISGVKVVQMFNQTEKSGRKFDILNTDYLQSQMRMIRVHAIFIPVVEAFSHLAISVLLYFGAYFIYQGSLKTGMLIAFLMYSRRFYRPVMDLSQKYNILQDAMTSSARIFDLMDTTDVITEPPSSTRVPSSIQGNIVFKDVLFAYNHNEWVLNQVNLSIRPGEKVALVGVTGSGKTTIVNLLARFYDYQKGHITLDGIELQEYPKEILRNQLAFVHQDFFIFAGTVLDNIRLWNKNISREQAIEAARVVNVHTFAEKLPQKYDEPILEGGSNLSTGQKQLISFARALAFKPNILILDEATSNIDSETEKLIQDALEKLLARQTSIIIAHRLSTIKNVDRILVLHKGCITEQGTHEHLLRKNGIYAQLHKLQFKELEDKV
ncbi:ABC transporter ATP-binding protein [candidate division CSSED10-310 bacterium]|uniref:ABC transporter ATP-binding protein n=1 Tax=candidate division CSSED10-310 bacterium TaxID=2855610 RepID=A0ABV6Z1U2_UNCC1